MSDLILLGVVGAPHGVRGEVRIKTFTGDPLAIADYGPLTDSKGRSFEITDIRPAKEVVVARLKGVTDRTAAEKLNGIELYVARDRLPQIEDEDVTDFSDPYIPAPARAGSRRAAHGTI